MLGRFVSRWCVEFAWEKVLSGREDVGPGTALREEGHRGMEATARRVGNPETQQGNFPLLTSPKDGAVSSRLAPVSGEF
jgi:hypothetical protein